MSQHYCRCCYGPEIYCRTCKTTHCDCAWSYQNCPKRQVKKPKQQPSPRLQRKAVKHGEA